MLGVNIGSEVWISDGFALACLVGQEDWALPEVGIDEGNRLGIHSSQLG
jgi:hypothetical protein